MGCICSKSKFQCLHVCKHWNLDFEEMYPNAIIFFFWHQQTKSYLDRYFALIKIFAQMWNNLSQNRSYVKAIIFASTLLQFRVIKYCARQKPKVILSVLRCVCFVCAVCVLLQFRVIKYCARQKPKVILSVLRRKKRIPEKWKFSLKKSPRKKTWRPFLILLRTMFFFLTQTLSRLKLRTLYCDRWIKAVFLRARFIIRENSDQLALVGWFHTSVLVLFRGNLVSF